MGSKWAIVGLDASGEGAGLSDMDPADVANTAAASTSDDASRADHVQALPL